ncbi:metallophosphoesterase [Streptomyces violascens]|uniref:metallophosphoesterase n=1 Tax=Streptomyces violascens TaxID=67381 RepID=UPI0036A619B5
MTRSLRRIMATTDVHSTFTAPTGMLTHLHTARSDSLLVDCGDFFEGSGYYRLGHGAIERSILLGLYDVLAPGNHGWRHHFEPALHRLTVCANALDHTGRLLFRPLYLADVGGRRVAVTAVISPQAFHAIPARQRSGHRVTDPAQALRQLMLAHQHDVDSWILLSHSGFDDDLELAAACPFLDVIFAGHCHSPRYGPARVGDTLILKGRELAAGYAAAAPLGTGWTAHTTRFPDLPAHRLPQELATIRTRLADVTKQLATPLGTIAAPYRNTLPDRAALLRAVATRLHTGLGANAILFNETALRPVPLGDTLTLGDLLMLEPFDNQLVHARVPGHFHDAPEALIAYLTAQTGPLITAPMPLPPQLWTVLTTDYLADTYLGGRTQQAGLRLAQALQHTVLAERAQQ